MQIIKTIRGVQDVIYPDSIIWQKIIIGAGSILESYGYKLIFLPVIEYTKLFSRSIGTDTDIVSKEMYSFTDRKGRNLSLRPEGTVSAARAMIENNLLHGRVREKIYYFGPMFRYERPQEGRYRQFYQLGCEVFGSSDSQQDAEIAELAVQIIKNCGITEWTFNINSVGCKECRGKYRTALKKYLSGKEKILCSDCNRRIETNTLRVLDCKNPKCKEVFTNGSGHSTIPTLNDFLCELCNDYFEKYKNYLRKRDIDFNINTRLVRGLDYYTGPVFELDIKENTIIAGGRYNELIKQLGGEPVPACGWALGIERLAKLSKIEIKEHPFVYIALLEDGSISQCRDISTYLRKKGTQVEEDFEDIPCSKKLKLADRKNADWVIIMGKKESQKNSISIKNLKSGIQTDLPFKELENIFNIIK